MKAIFLSLFSFLLSSVYLSTALECYICNEYDGRACYDKIDLSVIRSLECSHLFNGNLQRSANLERNVTALELIDSNTKTAPNNQYQCITLERYYKRENKSKMLRTCTRQHLNFCNEQQTLGYIYGFNVTQCKICTKDRCNGSGSEKVDFSSKIMLLLTLIYFGLK